MLHVTAVWSPSGLKANSDVLEPSIGFTISTLIFTSSLGRLSASVIFPSPTWLLPAQVMIVPSPDGEPSKVILALGSSLDQGDHASHMWKSVTLSNTVGSEAAIASFSATSNSADSNG